jgi:hypothetical protein
MQRLVASTLGLLISTFICNSVFAFEVQETCCRDKNRSTIDFKDNYYYGPIIDTHVHFVKSYGIKSNYIIGTYPLPQAVILLPTPSITEDRKLNNTIKKLHKSSKNIFGLCPTYMTIFNQSDEYYKKEAYLNKLNEIETNLSQEWCVGIGEIALRHQIKEDYQPHIEINYSNKAFQDILKILNKHNSVLDLHNEPILNNVSHEKMAFDDIEKIAKNYPNIKLILSHTAMTNPQNLQKLLDISPNVYTNFKHTKTKRWASFGLEPIIKKASIYEDWLMFFEKSSKKIMLGSDRKFMRNFKRVIYGRILDKKIRPLLGTLSKSSAENIGYRNAIKVYNLNPQMFD